MELQTVLNSLAKIRNGAYFNIVWKTDCDKYLTAAAKREGVHITKYVQTTCRKGIRYGKVKKVIDQKVANGDFYIDPKTGKTEITVEKHPWAETVIKNLIVKHKTTGKQYLVVYTSPNKPRISYLVNGHASSADKIKEAGYFQKSYWNKSEAIMMTIPIDNLLSIG